jgi:hypothetical protein
VSFSFYLFPTLHPTNTPSRAKKEHLSLCFSFSNRNTKQNLNNNITTNKDHADILSAFLKVFPSQIRLELRKFADDNGVQEAYSIEDAHGTFAKDGEGKDHKADKEQEHEAASEGVEEAKVDRNESRNHG